MSGIEQALRKLEASVADLGLEIERAARAAPALPRTTAEIEDALVEFAAAEADATEHFARFPGDASRPFLQSSLASQEDWTRCVRRRERASARIVEIGRALADCRAATDTTPAPAPVSTTMPAAGGEEIDAP